jgi:ketosteroid isomerase-like protein
VLPSEREKRVREAIEALFNGDFDTLGGISTSDAAFRSGLAAVEGRTYEGPHGLRQYLADLADTFESFERELVEVTDLDGRVLTRLRVHAVGRDSGFPVDAEYWLVAWFEGELISRVERFDDRDSALAAAGA